MPLTLFSALCWLGVPVAISVSGPAIAPAYLGDAGITFDAPKPVDWDSLLPPNLRRTTLERDSTRRAGLYADRSDLGTTEVTFRLPLPSALRAQHYYLADSAGILPFEPTDLQGTARIHWTERGATIEHIQVHGAVRAVLPPGRGRGFVLSSDTRLTLQMSPSVLTADALLAPNGKAYPDRGTPFWAILRQYSIEQTQPDTNRWIWVQWRPDAENREAGCTHRYSLFHAPTLPTLVATANDGCDV